MGLPASIHRVSSDVCMCVCLMEMKMKMKSTAGDEMMVIKMTAVRIRLRMIVDLMMAAEVVIHNH